MQLCHHILPNPGQRLRTNRNTSTAPFGKRAKLPCILACFSHNMICTNSIYNTIVCKKRGTGPYIQPSFPLNVYVCMHGGFALTWHAAERIPRAQCRQQVFSRLQHTQHTESSARHGGRGRLVETRSNSTRGKPSREDTHRTYMLVPTNNTVPAHQRNALFSAQ